jgi:hypothetical protein
MLDKLIEMTQEGTIEISERDYPVFEYCVCWKGESWELVDSNKDLELAIHYLYQQFVTL